MPNLPDTARIDDPTAPYNTSWPRIKERLIDIDGSDTWFQFVESENGMEIYIKGDDVNYTEFFKKVHGWNWFKDMYDDLFGPKDKRA